MSAPPPFTQYGYNLRSVVHRPVPPSLQGVEAHICLFAVQAPGPAELAGAVPDSGMLTGGQDLPLFIPHVPVLQKVA